MLKKNKKTKRFLRTKKTIKCEKLVEKRVDKRVICKSLQYNDSLSKRSHVYQPYGKSQRVFKMSFVYIFFAFYDDFYHSREDPMSELQRAL